MTEISSEELDGLLADVDAFRDLPPAALADVRGRCRWRHYAAGQHIIHHRDASTDVYFIPRGRVRAIVYSATGKEISYQDLEAGSMFGEVAAVDGRPRSTHVVALADSTVFSMTASDFWEVIRRYPEVAAVTLQRLAGIIRLLVGRVLEFSTLPVKGRLYAELLRLARREADTNTAVIAQVPTHAQLASRISTHREAVTRELNELDRARLTERRGDALVLLDVTELEGMRDALLGE